MPTHETTVDPVVKSISIDRDIEATFRLFTEEINPWWPLETHSVSEELGQCAAGGTCRGQARRDQRGR